MKKTYIQPKTEIIDAKIESPLLGASGEGRYTSGNGPAGPVSDDDEDAGDESLAKPVNPWGSWDE